MSFEDDLAAEVAADIRYKDVDILLNGAVHTIRFLQVSGGQWAAACDRNPVRPGAAIDLAYGYDIRGVAREISQVSGRRLVGDDLLEISPEAWHELYRTLPGGVLSEIDDAIFALNEVEPRQEVKAARKALEGQPAPSSK